MNSNDFEKFGKLIVALGEVYSKTISPAVVKLYWSALRQYEYPVIEKAVSDIISTHKYNTMPLPANFLEAINPQSATDLRVLDAIKTMEQTMIIASSYQSVLFLDSALTATIENFGGWIELCRQTREMTDRDYTFFIKEFERVYRAFCNRNDKPKILLGRLDRDNMALGYLSEDFVLTLPNGEQSKQALPYCPDGKIIDDGERFILPNGETIEPRLLLE